MLSQGRGNICVDGRRSKIKYERIIQILQQQQDKKEWPSRDNVDQLDQPTTLSLLLEPYVYEDKKRRSFQILEPHPNPLHPLNRWCCHRRRLRVGLIKRMLHIRRANCGNRRRRQHDSSLQEEVSKFYDTNPSCVQPPSWKLMDALAVISLSISRPCCSSFRPPGFKKKMILKKDKAKEWR